MGSDKYLFIVTESESANGICAKKVMQSLAERGHEVFCITNREYGMDHTFVSGGVSYVAIKQRFVMSIDSYLRHAKPSSLKKRILKAVFKILNKLKLMSAYFSWPLISPSYCRRYCREALRLVKEHDIDCIVPIYKQIDPLIAGSMIKKRMPEKVVIPVLFDALSGGSGPRIFSEKKMIKRGLRWEKKVLYNADAVVAMESSREHYERYKEKCGFYSRLSFLDIPLISRPEPSLAAAPDVFENGKINLLFVGTIVEHIRNPKKLFEVFLNIKNDDLRLNIVGTNDCPELMKAAASTDSRVKLIPFMSHGEVTALMDKADVLVNIGNNTPSLVPSKIFEYMSKGKPIISTAPIDNEPSARYLDRYRLAFVLYENRLDCDKASKELEAFILEGIKDSVPFEETKKEFYLNTPEAFCDFLQNVTGA